MTQRVMIGDFPAVLRKRLRMDLAEAQAAALDACWMARREARRMTKALDLIYLETYYESFYARPTTRGAVLGNDAPYALVIEKGRRPNRPGPPLLPIQLWVQKKLGLSGAEAKDAAFAIRRHIHEEGTEPHNIVQLAAIKLETYHRAACQRRLRRGAA